MFIKEVLVCSSTRDMRAGNLHWWCFQILFIRGEHKRNCRRPKVVNQASGKVYDDQDLEEREVSYRNKSLLSNSSKT